MSIKTESSYFADPGVWSFYFEATGATDASLEDVGATNIYFEEFQVSFYSPDGVTLGYFTSDSKYYTVNIYA